MTDEKQVSLMTTDVSNLKANLYNPGAMVAFLRQIKSDADSLSADVTTVAGRKERKSAAFRISKFKVAIDKIGKDEQAEAKAKVDSFNSQRKRARDFLVQLKVEVLQPITDYEESIQQAEDDVAAEFQKIEDLDAPDLTVEQMGENLVLALDLGVGDEFGERQNEALMMQEAVVESLTQRIEDETKKNTDSADLERFRQQEVDNVEAGKKATEDAEAAAAQKEREDWIASKATEGQAAELEDEKAKSAKAAEGEEAAKEALRQVTENAAKIAEEEAETARLQKARDDAAERVKQDRKHRQKIHIQIVADLQLEGSGITKAMAVLIMQAILDKKIPDVEVRY